MKTVLRFLTVAALLLVLPVLAFGGIGENFAAAGTYLGGTAGFQASLGSIEAMSLSDYRLWLAPLFGFLIVDNLSLSVTPSFDLWGVTAPASATWQIGVSGSLSKYFVSQPEATTGPVPSIGASLGMNYRSNGQMWLSLSPSCALDYFLTSRIAVRTSLSGFGVGLSMIPGPLFFYDWLSPQLSVGMTWFIPNRDRVLFPAK